MAGHSHWAQIKRAKGANDAKRGKLFSRLSREITVAVRMGGSDPGMNARLRQAIATAKSENMPVDTIDRAIKKGAGELDGAGSIEELTYEGYAPGGVALLIETVTDNKNRTAAEIRSLFSKNNGNLGNPGSVAWMFQRVGLITVAAGGRTEDDLLDAVLDAGVEDIREAEDVFEIITPPEKLAEAADALAAAGIETKSAALTYLPENLTEVSEASVASQVLRLYEVLDDHDDVQNVYANFDIAPEILDKVSGN